MLSENRVKELKRFAIEIRRKTVEEIATLGIGHVGGCMSICELMACLYGEILNIDPKNPKWSERDRFIMSKGHAGPTMYAALALKGFFPVEQLKTLNLPNTCLPSHTDHNKTLGVDMTTGSLGQGFSTGVGVALGCKLNRCNNKVYILIGDGEAQEGQVWEAAMFSAHYKLSNLILFIDKNGRQLDGPTEKVMNIGNIGNKFREFGWFVQNVDDGHNVKLICDAVENAKNNNEIPSAIVLNTVKGKDCPACDRVINNHNMSLSMMDYVEVCDLLDKQLEKLN